MEGSDDMQRLSLSRDSSNARDTIVFIVTVRVFEKNELPGILRIERESFDRDAWPRDTFLEYAAAVPDLFLVARVAGRIAGYSIAYPGRHGAEIASLGVRPVYRRSGVATALLRATLRKLRRSGAKAVWLMVRRQNEEAIRLYRKLGFVRTGTVPDYYGDHSSGWRMRMDLSKGLRSGPARPSQRPETPRSIVRASSSEEASLRPWDEGLPRVERRGGRS